MAGTEGSPFTASAPALATKQLLNEWPYLVFLSFAKSGATISSGVGRSQLLNQLVEAKLAVGTHRIDALIMSIGGNDIGFADNLRMFGLITGFSSFVQTGIQRKIDALDQKLYPLINQKISEFNLNIGTILIMEYPGSLFNDRNDQPAGGCGVFDFDNSASIGPALSILSIDAAEAKVIDTLVHKLNKVIANAASREGWHLIDGIDEEFVGHGYCSGQSWFVFAENSCLDQGDFDGTMHPNAVGTEHIAKVVASELRTVLPKPPTVSRQPAVKTNQ
ncbi:MAG: hypothetical protein ABI675_21045 [Chitinophagaceae bacterium]